MPKPSEPRNQSGSALTRAELVELRAGTAALVADLRDVRREVQALLDVALAKQRERYVGRVQLTEQALTRGVETQDHGAVVAAVTALLNSHEEMARDWYSETMQACRGRRPRRTRGAAPPPHAGCDHTLRLLNDTVRCLAERAGLPLREEERPLPLLPPRAEAPAADAPPHPFPSVIETLRDRFGGSAFRSDVVTAPGLTAAQCRLLDTVVTQSALAPDVATLRDVYHPCVALYDTRWDRDWAGRDHGGVHLGVFTSTVLTEFAVHGNTGRRFTLCHLLRRMGFQAADVHAAGALLDESLYQRLATDPALTFLAQHQCPKLLVLRGSRWARLLDHYLEAEALDDGALPSPPWSEDPVTHQMARATLDEIGGTPLTRLAPHTVLAALWRRERLRDTPFSEWSLDRRRVVELQNDFLVAVGRIPGAVGSALCAAVHGQSGSLRAWPVCLRGLAVRHVRDRVRSGRLYPATPGILLAAAPPPLALPREAQVAAVADWLVGLRGPAAAEDASERLRTHDRVAAALLPADAWWEGGAEDAEELDEERLRAAVAGRYGPVTPAAERRLQDHLERLAATLLAVAQQGQEHWTAAERAMHQHLPEEVVHGMEQDGLLLLSESEYRVACSRRLRRLVDGGDADDDDGITNPDAVAARLLGESQMRPGTLFPDA